VKNSLNSSHLKPLEIFLRRAQNWGKSFQKLVILVRDWDTNQNYGFEGGKEYLKKKLNGRNGNSYQLIESSFHSALCYLWPKPLNEMSDENFKGKLCQLDERFSQHLEYVIPKITQELLSGTKLKARELSQHMKNSFDSIIREEPLLSLIDLHLSHKLTITSKIILNDAKAKFGKELKIIKIKGNRRNSEKIEDIIELREKISTEVVIKFTEKSNQGNDIFDQKLSDLKEKLKTSLNLIEENSLVLLCYESLRKLRTSFSKEIDSFIHKGFLGKYFTKESSIINKIEEMVKDMENELQNCPELAEIFADGSIIDTKDELKNTLQNHKGRRLGAGFGTALTLIFAVTGGFASIAVGGGFAAAKGAVYIGKAATKEVAEEVSANAAKQIVGSVVGTASGTLLESFVNFLRSLKPSKKEQSINSNDQNDTEIFSNEKMDFMESFKDLLIIINRYRVIGGDIAELVEQAKEAEK
jgi:hypothetical protein